MLGFPDVEAMFFENIKWETDMRLIPVLMAVALVIFLSNFCSKLKPEKLEDRRQALLQIAKDYRFAKQTGESALKDAGLYAEADSSSFWLFVSMVCSNGHSGHDKAALDRMSELARYHADAAKERELFQLVSSGRVRDALLQALIASGATGNRKWEAAVEVFANRPKIDPYLTISDGKAIEKMLADINDFIKERDRLFRRSFPED